MRWRNGAGWTREIACHPANDEIFDWRASIAEINQDGPFSPFPGCDRHQVLLQGMGVALSGPDLPQPLVLQPPHGMARYAGDIAIDAALTDGPVQVFNLIHRRDRLRVDVLHRPLTGSLFLFPEARTCWLIHLMAGRLSAKGSRETVLLAAGDSLLLKPDADGARVALDGAGEAIFAKLVRPD